MKTTDFRYCGQDFLIEYAQPTPYGQCYLHEIDFSCGNPGWGEAVLDAMLDEAASAWEKEQEEFYLDAQLEER